MKLSFDNALLWIIPYLYLVSVGYYWGYWGTLNIDAFNYYDLADLVKGVTAPLGATVLSVGTLGFTVIVLRGSLDRLEERHPGWHTAVLLILLLPLIVSIFYIFYLTSTKSASASSQLYIPGLFTGLPGMLIALRIDKRLPKIGILDGAIRFAAILFVTSLPFYAYDGGRSNAISIKSGTEFDYLISDALDNHKTIHKFLGKAGGFYFSSTIDNQKRIISSTDKLSPLTIMHYLNADSLSVAQYEALQKSLVADLSKPIQVQRGSDQDVLSTAH